MRSLIFRNLISYAVSHTKLAFVSAGYSYVYYLIHKSQAYIATSGSSSHFSPTILAPLNKMLLGKYWNLTLYS